jgi:hypothetical protein
VISPDGRQIAFQWVSERNELRILSLDGGSTPLHRSEGVADYMVPQGFTPDGEHLLVVRTLSDRTRQIAMVAIRDGALRPLKSFAWEYVQASQ